jgi:hypothetical protein
MVIHSILLLLDNIALRAGKVVSDGLTGLATTCGGLEGSRGATLLRITGEAVTDVLGHLGAGGLKRVGAWVALIVSLSAFNFFVETQASPHPSLTYAPQWRPSAQVALARRGGR